MVDREIIGSGAESFGGVVLLIHGVWFLVFGLVLSVASTRRSDSRGISLIAWRILL
jgi:hypothetical protein